MIAASAAIRAASASDAGTRDRMGWDNRFLGMVAIRRGIALLALALLVLSVFARPAIPDLADRSSPASAVLLSEEDRRADPVTEPVAWPPYLNSTIASALARISAEPARGFPPIKISAPLIAADDPATAHALGGSPGSDLDRGALFQISAVGSARTPTGPPLPIA